MFDKYNPLIAEAKSRIYHVAKQTTLDYAKLLSKQLNNDIWLKREDQQPVFSYKLRGAFNLIASLPRAEKARGVIAASAGNHAQGVALAAKHEEIASTIVMPKTTPEIKVSAARHLGAEVILHGNTYDDAQEYALKLAAEEEKAFIPAYDHPLVIAGQATIGVELIEQLPNADMVFVPVGGGGLIAGICLAVKAVNPSIKIIGVEPDDAPCMQQALLKRERVILKHIGIFADGAAVKQVGEEPFKIAQKWVYDVLLVSVDDICAAVQNIFEEYRSIAEPAGALALAGLKQYVAAHKLNDKKLVAILSGSNVNFDRLRYIAELAAVGGQNEAIIGVTIAEAPGSFKRFCHDLGDRSITEFNYRYSDATTAIIFVGVQLKNGKKEKEKLLESLSEKNYQVIDLSDNALAKTHVRHMVGGNAPMIANELLYRFEFPERKGALLHFLTKMHERWNISLFHYRNHGAAYGHVLMGIQVPPEERALFSEFITKLRIKYHEETENPAYKMFLGK